MRLLATDPGTVITERDFQHTVVEMARAYGWRVYGVLDQREYSKRLSKGFPDLVMARDGALIFAELKSEKGRVSADQQAWLDALRLCTETYLWRPSDLDTIEEVLK